MFGDPAHEASDVDSLRRCHRRRASSLEERLGRADVVDTQERLAEHQERVARSIDRGRVPELDRRTERPRSCARRAGREERLTGVPQMLGRSFGLTGGLEVAGDHLAVLHHPLARRRLEPRRSAAVQHRTVAEEDGLVGDVTEQRVLEQVLTSVLERRVIPAEHELTGTSVVERLLRDVLVTGQGAHRVVPEDPSDDGRALQRSPVPRVERVEASLEHPRQRRRDRTALKSRRGRRARRPRSRT